MRKIIPTIMTGLSFLSGIYELKAEEMQKAQIIENKTSSVQINGDARQRYQGFRDRFGGAPNLDIFSSRFRLSPSLRVNENIEVKARGVADFATTPNLDPRLTDGEEFSIDRAYVKISDGKDGKLTFEAGERESIFNSTNPLADKDVPSVGAAIEYRPFKGVSLQGEYGNGSMLTEDSKLRNFGGQIVAEKSFADGNMILQGNLGYRHFAGNDKEHQFSNSADAQFDIASAGVAAVFPKLPVVRSARVYVEGLCNQAMPNKNSALMTGFKIGNADRPKGIEFFAFYNVKVEQNSYPSVLMDRDCPRTNFGAFGAGVRWSPMKNLSIYAVSRNPKHIIPAGRKDDQRMKTFEAGVIYKF